MDLRSHCFIWDVCASLLICTQQSRRDGTGVLWNGRHWWGNGNVDHTFRLAARALGPCRVLGNGFATPLSVSDYLEPAHRAFTRSQALDEQLGLIVTRPATRFWSRSEFGGFFHARLVLGRLACIIDAMEQPPPSTAVKSGAAAIAPMLGGRFADFFALHQLTLAFTWTGGPQKLTVQVLNLHSWTFFFAMACILGLYSLHRLSFVEEPSGATK